MLCSVVKHSGNGQSTQDIKFISVLLLGPFLIYRRGEGEGRRGGGFKGYDCCRDHIVSKGNEGGGIIPR